MKPKHIEVIVRAVVIHHRKVLLCYLNEGKHYFFPGGHVEVGESVMRTLRREFKEELGIVPTRAVFIGAVENEFKEKRHGAVHEINLVFHVSVKKLHTKSREDHISFTLTDEEEFSHTNVLPLVLKRAVRKWLHDRKMFWVSSME